MPDNTWSLKPIANYFFFKIALKIKKWQVLLSLHKMFLDNNYFFQIMTRIIPIEPSIPREPKVPDNTQRAKSARQYPESQKRQTIPGEPKVSDNTWIANYFFSQNCFEKKKWQVLLSLHKMFLDNNYFFSNNDQNNTH